MATEFFTNDATNTLLQKFKGIFESNRDIEFFDALIGYFRASGYFKLRQFLYDVLIIRILVRINVDKIVEKYHSKGLLFQGAQIKRLLNFKMKPLPISNSQNIIRK